MRDSHDLYGQTIHGVKDKEQNQATSIQQAIKSCNYAAANWASWSVVDEAHCKDAKIMLERDTQQTHKKNTVYVSVWIGAISCVLDRKIIGLT